MIGHLDTARAAGQPLMSPGAFILVCLFVLAFVALGLGFYSAFTAQPRTPIPARPIEPETADWFVPDSEQVTQKIAAGRGYPRPYVAGRHAAGGAR